MSLIRGKNTVCVCVCVSVCVCEADAQCDSSPIDFETTFSHLLGNRWWMFVTDGVFDLDEKSEIST